MTTRRVLAGALATLLMLPPAGRGAAAQALVVGNSEAAPAPGSIFLAGEVVDVAAGQRLSLLAGETLTVTEGPTTVTVPSTGAPLELLATLSTALQASVATFGPGRVVRQGSGRGVPPSVWHLDIAGGGKHCRRRGGVPDVWRADPSAARELQVQDVAAAEDAFVRWPAGTASVRWPFSAERTDDGVYLLDLPPDTTQNVELVTVPDAATDAGWLTALARHGCAYQLYLASRAVAVAPGQ